MALIMAACAAVSLLALPRVSAALKPLASDPKRELLGFGRDAGRRLAAGYWIARQALILIGPRPERRQPLDPAPVRDGRDRARAAAAWLGGAARRLRDAQPLAVELLRAAGRRPSWR
jgi:hypothetical protein